MIVFKTPNDPDANTAFLFKYNNTFGYIVTMIDFLDDKKAVIKYYAPGINNYNN